MDAADGELAGEAGSPGHTIGVVIAIPSPYREVLESARVQYEPATSDLPAHITILAPVDVDAEAMPAVEAHLAYVARSTRPFRVILRGTGSFRPVSPVVFVAVADGGAACELLEARVRSGDMAVETRFPYHPHVTLAHDVNDHLLDRAFADLAGFDAVLEVEAIGLYEHIDGIWFLVREFTLTGT